jgi:hypothetical protein
MFHAACGAVLARRVVRGAGLRRPTTNRGKGASTLSGLSQIGEAVVKMDIEARLFRAHVELYDRRREEPGSIFVGATGRVRNSALRVVLGSSADPFTLWLELFDHNRRISLDSGSARNLEKAWVQLRNWSRMSSN